MRALSINSTTLILTLLIILSLLEYRFLFGADSVLKVIKLKRAIVAQQQQLDTLQARNVELQNKIAILKQYPTAVEEQARYELGMVREGEQYFQVVEPIE